VGPMGEMRNAYKIFAGKYEGKRPRRRSGVFGKTILKWMLGIQGVKLWTGFMSLSIGTSGVPL
jgi:hypothetical protein